MTEAVETVEATNATKIRPNIANMIKTKSGSYHKDDFIGTTLAGLTVDQVKVIATECGIDATKYSHLNPGQQRMTLGNSLRKLTNMVEETGEGATLDKLIAANVEAEKARDQIEELANGMKEANEQAAAAKQAEKDAAKAAKAAAAAAVKKVGKVADSTEGEGSVE